MDRPTIDQDDLHDRGLAFDLATMRARALPPTLVARRGALKLLAGAGAGLIVAACGNDSKSSSGTTSTSSGVTSTTAGSSTTGGSSGTATEAIPEETAGPFPGDGSNGPNVLTESGIVRTDIRSSFGNYSGTAAGVPLKIELTVVNAGSGAALADAAVYLWHCDRDGGYSLYSQGVTAQNYLRGVQQAKADGRVTFTSIFPAAYSGRWPHIHFEVFPSLEDATGAGSKLVTSQLALPKAACDVVYAADGYSQSVSNLSGSSLESDNVFSDGSESQLAEVSGDAKGMTASLTFGVAA